MSRTQATSPLRVLTPENSGPGAWVYLSTYGGGLLGGDVTQVTLDVGRSAIAYVSTQSTTKVFRARDGQPTRQTLEAQVAEDGLLALLPDPVCCFAGAYYRQEQVLRLTEDASLVLLDWMTSGRHARGERWSADSRTSNEIWVNHRCLWRDRTHLTPGRARLGMDYFNCLATLVLVGPRTKEGAAAMAEQLSRAPVAAGSGTQFGLSPLGADKRGMILRAAGPDMEAVARLIFPLLQFIAAALGEAPWQRKW